MNIHVQNFVMTYVFIFLGSMLRSEFIGSNDNSMFNFVKKCQTAFYSGYTILYFYLQQIRVLISPQPFQHLLVSDFLMMGLVLGKEWVVSHCGFDLHFPEG